MVKHRRSLDRVDCHLKPGFLSFHLEGFLQDMQHRGYTELTAQGYAASVCHFHIGCKDSISGWRTSAMRCSLASADIGVDVPVGADNMRSLHSTRDVRAGSFVTCVLQG